MENAFISMQGYKTCMLSKWLNLALSESEVNQSELSRLLTEALGKSVDRAAVNKMLKGTRAISAEELLAIEQITGKSAPTKITVPLKGRVGAGQAVEPLDDNSIEFVDAPRDANTGTVAVEVFGESMHPAYESGTLLFYSKTLPPQELINRRCVVKLDDGRVFVKVLRTGSDAGLWTLQSLNSLYPDIEDVAVEWAASIDWIKPR